jgi:hypothetical protein
MARGNQNQDNYSNFYVKLQGLKKGSKECFFEFKQKQGDTYVVTDKNSSFDGVLESIKQEEIEHEGKKKPVLKITLRDDFATERYILTLGMNNVSRSLISSLSTADKLESLSFWTMMGDKGFPIFVAKANGSQEKLQWGHDMVELQKKLVTEHKIGDDIIRDYSALDKFLLGEILPTVIAKVVPAPKASVMTTKDALSEVTKPDIYKASEQSSSDDADDDLPF